MTLQGAIYSDYCQFPANQPKPLGVQSGKLGQPLHLAASLAANMTMGARHYLLLYFYRIAQCLALP